MEEDNTQYFNDEWNKENILIIDLNTNKEYSDINEFLKDDLKNNLIFGTNTIYKIINQKDKDADKHTR